MRFSIVLSLLCAASLPAWAIDPTLRDVEYARAGGRSLKLDLYMPRHVVETPAVTVIWVHGGAWRSGSKDKVPVTRWRDAGMAIASVDYRLSPEARFPAQIQDIKAAIRFLRAHAERYHLDPQRFIIAGSSAGGHLAALTGVSSDVPELEGDLGDYTSTDSGVQAIVSFYGASNLQSILGQSTEHGLSVRVPALELLLGGQPDENPERAKLASPVAHVDANDPPLWLIHGDADPQMPIEQSYELSAEYKKKGLDVRLDVVKDGKHGGAEFFSPQRLDRIAAGLRNLSEE